MSIEETENNGGDNDLNLWSTDALRDKANELFTPTIDVTTLTRQELIEMLKVVEDLNSKS